MNFNTFWTGTPSDVIVVVIVVVVVVGFVAPGVNPMKVRSIVRTPVYLIQQKTFDPKILARVETLLLL